MIYVRIELWPWGQKDKSRVLGEIEIANDGTGTLRRRNPGEEMFEPFDPLHPNGRCTCCGEGRCEWCSTLECEVDRLRVELGREREIGAMACQALEGCAVGCNSQREFLEMLEQWERETS